MGSRVAEVVVRKRPFGRAQRLRVDLHGVSVFGPGDQHQVMRWEWIEHITVDGGVIVAGGGNQIVLPAGAFGLEPDTLAACLREADSIDGRTEAIGRLNAASPGA